MPTYDDEDPALLWDPADGPDPGGEPNDDWWRWHDDPDAPFTVEEYGPPIITVDPGPYL